jgi:ribosomal protein L11 methyltransferase
MRWAAIRAACPPESEEPVAACFTEIDCGGVLIETADRRPPTAGETGPASTAVGGRSSAVVYVTGYLPVDDRLEDRLAALKERLAALRDAGLDPGDDVTVRFVQDEDWAEAWKAYFRPIRVGRSLVIKPSWETLAATDGDRVIELDPGMAFGTGAHPTTQLCLTLLEERVAPGDRVLDLGTGSGILALAAARLGAREVLALDLDPIAVAAARENVSANGLAALVRVEEGGVEAASDPSYDLVVANILADVIRDLAPALARLVRPGGLLIASGIIAERAADVTAALRAAGFDPEEERAQEEWRALVGRRSGE